MAEVAGVSEMTVSRVLRRSGAVSQRTRAHVLQVVEDLGYVQNRLAGSLAEARSNQVAVIIPSLTNNFFTELMSGITTELEKVGYNAVVGISEYNLSKEEALIHSMMSWRPAGIIVPNIFHTSRARRILKNAGIPVVEVMNLTSRPIDISVGLNQRAAGTVMADHLLSRGYRRFAFIGWQADDRSAIARFSAVHARLTGGGGTVLKPAPFEHPPSFSGGKAALSALLDAHREVEAVVFSNDTAATGGLVHCLDAGMSLPDDIALAGFGGLEIGQHMPQPLTTILAPRFEVGRLAARSVLNRLSGVPTERIRDVGFKLIVGRTA